MWAEGETVVTYTGSPDSGAEISVKAAPGKANSIDFRRCMFPLCGGSYLFIRDTAGVKESSPHCQAASSTEVRCTVEDLLRLTANTGDGPDRSIVNLVGGVQDVWRASVVAGRGNDTVTALSSRQSQVVLGGGLGRDSIRLRGRGTIRGGDQADVLRGGPGPQRIFGGRGNDRISCGKGRDVASGGNGVDRGGAGCERVLDPWGKYGGAEVES